MKFLKQNKEIVILLIKVIIAFLAIWSGGYTLSIHMNQGNNYNQEIKAGGDINGPIINGSGNIVNGRADYILSNTNFSGQQQDGSYLVHLIFKSSSPVLPSRLCVVVWSDAPIIKIGVVGSSELIMFANYTYNGLDTGAINCFNGLKDVEDIVVRLKREPKNINAYATTTNLLPYTE